MVAGPNVNDRPKRRTPQRLGCRSIHMPDGAGSGNRTRTSSLGSWQATTTSYPPAFMVTAGRRRPQSGKSPYRPHRKVSSWNHAKGARNMNAGHRVAFPGALWAVDPPVPGCFVARDGFSGAGGVPEGRDRPVRQWRPTGGASVLSGADRAVFGAPRDQAPPETRDGPEDMEHGISGGGCRVDPFPGADRVDLSGPEAVDGPMEFPGRAARAVGPDGGGGVVGSGPVERGRQAGPPERLVGDHVPERARGTVPDRPVFPSGQVPVGG